MQVTLLGFFVNGGSYSAPSVVEPSAQPTSLVFSLVTNESMTVSYTAASGSPDGYIAVRRSGAAPTSDPVDGTVYEAGDTLGDGTVVYVGSGVTFNQISLTAATTYHYKIYSYNGSGAEINYRQTSPLTGSQATNAETGSQLYVEQFTSNSINKDLMVYLPPNYTTNIDYPVIIFYHGDGGKGVFTRVTDQFIATADGIETVFSGSYTNASGDVIYSAVVKVDDTVVAIGTPTGFTGDDVVVSTNNYKNNNGTFSITFGTPLPVGGVVSITYQYSALMSDAGIPIYLNDGDEPEGVIIVAPQMNTTNFSLVWDFDQLKTHLEANYPIDTNRYYVTGLSRGGFIARDLIINRFSDIAASIPISANYVAITDWLDNTDVGKFYHHGVSDDTVTYSITSTLANSNAVNLNLPAETASYWFTDAANGHSATVWNTGVYNRRDRTDATGTSKFDYIQWFKKFSKDATQRATLHTELAEETLNVSDYRKALFQVNNLGAGATKTALLVRLAAVYALIGKVYTIDIVTSGNESAENFNNLTTAVSSTVLSNLIDIDGVASVYDFTVVNQFGTSGALVQQTQMAGRYHGFPRSTNEYGAVVTHTTITNGQVKFSSLNGAKTYKIIIYAGHWQSGTLTQSELTITINSVAKVLYTQDNTYHTIEFSGIAPSAGEIVIDVQATKDRNSRITAIDLIEMP